MSAWRGRNKKAVEEKEIGNYNKERIETILKIGVCTAVHELCVGVVESTTPTQEF